MVIQGDVSRMIEGLDSSKRPSVVAGMLRWDFWKRDWL